MKIRSRGPALAYFKAISIGECFLRSNGGEDHLYVATTPFTDSNDKVVNAVSLKSGCLVYFEPNSEVIPLDNAEVLY